MDLGALSEGGCEPVVVVEDLAPLLLLQGRGMSHGGGPVVHYRLAQSRGVYGSIFNLQNKAPLQSLEDRVCEGGRVAGREGNLAGL